MSEFGEMLLVDKVTSIGESMKMRFWEQFLKISILFKRDDIIIVTEIEMQFFGSCLNI